MVTKIDLSTPQEDKAADVLRASPLIDRTVIVDHTSVVNRKSQSVTITLQLS